MSRRIFVVAAGLVWLVGPASAYETIAVEHGGTLAGVVRYAGTPPPPRTVPITKDRGVCGQEKTQADVEVGDGGGLRDAAVVVRASRGKALVVPAEPVVFDQRGCEYVPRVLAFPAGTTIAVLNSDDTLHNVHVQARTNPEVNRAMPRLQKRIAWRVEKAEWPMAVQCDTHPWMRAWWLSMDQPYYAVTDAAGRFAIADLPPGEYAVDVWHPTLGKRTEQATIRPGETTPVTWSVGPPQ